MLHLIFYQFSYSYRKWLGTIPVFFTASIITGICLTIFFSVNYHAQVFTRGLPTPLFVAPIFFGGITLLLLIANLIQLLIHSFKDDYRLWIILGANRIQLSLLVGGQLSIIACFSSIIGAFLSPFISRSYYKLVQRIVGHAMLPTIEINFNWSAFTLSVLIVTLLAFIGSFRYSLKILKKGNLLESHSSLTRQKGKKRKFLGLVLASLFWLGLIVASFLMPFFDLPGPRIYVIAVQVNIGFYLLILHSLILQMLSPWLKTKLIKLVFSKISSYGMVMAKWHVLKNRSYLRLITISLVTALTLVTGLLLLTDSGMRSSQSEGIQETLITFLFYLAAPILIILSNIISSTLLSSQEEKRELTQWRTLGVSKRQTAFIRFCESLIYCLTIVVIASLFNGVIALLVLNSARTSPLIKMNIHYLYLPTLIMMVIFFTLIFLTKVSNSLDKE